MQERQNKGAISAGFFGKPVCLKRKEEMGLHMAGQINKEERGINTWNAESV